MAHIDHARYDQVDGRRYTCSTGWTMWCARSGPKVSSFGYERRENLQVAGVERLRGGNTTGLHDVYTDESLYRSGGLQIASASGGPGRLLKRRPGPSREHGPEDHPRAKHAQARRLRGGE
jgi:hypothetical protein